MHTAAYKVDVASNRRRRENVPRHILFYHSFICSRSSYRKPGYMHRSSWSQGVPVPSGVLRQNAGSARPPWHAGNGSDLQRPGLLRHEECYRKWCGLSALGRLRKNNITQYNMKIKQAILHSSSIFNRINFKKGRK